MTKKTALRAVPDRSTVSPAIVTHTYVRLRGKQDSNISVTHARTELARVSLVWGTLLLTFHSAQAAQGVLEGFSAMRSTLIAVPPAVATHVADDGYDHPAIAINWTHRPSYATMPREKLATDQRTMLRWAELYMGPITFQVLDRAAFDSGVEILRDAHRTAVAVCLDGGKYRADPTRDDYRPPQQ